MERGRRFRSWLAGTSTLAVGLLAGTAAVVLAGTAVAHQTEPASGSGHFIEATHVPPLLTTAGETVELRYDAYCTPAQGVSPEARCAANGTVFARAGNSGSFQALPLGDTGKAEGRFAAVVPASIAGSPTGFSYYAELRNAGTGATTTLPAAGPSAPQRSIPMGAAIDIALGAHQFGGTVAADERVVETTWGTGAGQVGLEEGPEQAPIGGASFDVGADGRVNLLDEANKRVLRFEAGAGAPTAVALDINGTIADLALAANGQIHVLESVGDGENGPLLRTFASGGTPAGAVQVAGGASEVLMGPSGPVVHEQQSGHWTSTMASGQPLTRSAQQASGQIGRPMGPDRQVVVLRTGNEIRVALVEAGAARKSWRLTSNTPVAEVQLAEAVGDRLVVVARMYSDTDDEFIALVLGAGGVEQRLAIASADWAETAPLSRFRLVGSSLYRLGSTPEHVFVDRFDLEVN